MKRSVVFAGILFACVYHHAQACNVPAFRYALERWPADPYQILVYYESRPQGEAFDFLQKGAANYSLRRVDAGTPEGKALAQERKIAAFPWVEVFYPVHFQSRAPLWSGPLTFESARRILDSPARSTIAKRLLGGEVAVWVLIKSGHEREDSRALAALETNLEKSSSKLRMPEVGTDLNGNPIQVADFKSYPVRFGVVPVARDDPQEALLVNALLNSEPDLEQHREPMAFPVFGRGRALYALVGDGIQENTITEACQSLLNWCSCEIKAQNPGTDLLVAADWSRPYGGRMVLNPELPPLAGLGGFREAAKEPREAAESRPPSDLGPARAACAVPAAAAVAAKGPAPSPAGSPLARNMLYLAGGAGLALVGISVLVSRRGRRE